jgi:Caspase domain
MRSIFVSNVFTRLALVGLWAAVWLCGGITPGQAERRVALVIGNSDYRSVALLPNPRRDAKAVADTLREIGFDVVKLEMDLGRDAMVRALRAFREEADKADWAPSTG